MLATRDYVLKNGFTDVVFGLSGGIDSSLVALIAADAIGPEHVHAVSMPSRYSSEGSRTDADALCEAAGIELRTIPIEPAFTAFIEMLAPSFEGLPEDLTEENLQPRIRGTLLMALSNKFRGWLVLTTGNKSELAVGYSTLYGDTAGGFAVIKDVPKLLVYDLCRLRNQRAGREIIPEAVLTKPPSAELRPDQRDDQSLPPYEELDPLLEAYVEDDLTRGELVAQGFDPAMVDRITRLVDLSEYKRRQNPPGPAHQRQGVRQGPAHADHERLPRVRGVTIRAVLFDFAGVLTSSPWAALAAAGGGDLELVIGSYEEDTDHPWHQVERGEMTIVDWMTRGEGARRGQGRGGRLLAVGGAARRDDRARSDRRSRPRAP